MTPDNSPSRFSVDAQIAAFRRQVEGEPSTVKTIPGCLFRDGQDRSFSVLSEHSQGNWWQLGRSWIDDGLLKKHAETHRRGIEESGRLLERIRAVEILEMVRDKWWGKGEIQKTHNSVILRYNYLQTFSETEKGGYTPIKQYPGRWTPFGGDQPGYSTGGWDDSFHPTGRWVALDWVISEVIKVNFGNTQFPYQGTLPGSENNPYPAWNDKNADLAKFPWMPYFLDFYRRREIRGLAVHESFWEFQSKDYPIPQQVWTRPDNLVICVTAPYSVIGKKCGFGLNEKFNVRGFQREYKHHDLDQPTSYIRERPFDQTSARQDIIAYLDQALAAQQKSGDLPPQREAVELGKIQIIREKGLLSLI